MRSGESIDLKTVRIGPHKSKLCHILTSMCLSRPHTLIAYFKVMPNVLLGHSSALNVILNQATHLSGFEIELVIYLKKD